MYIKMTSDCLGRGRVALQAGQVLSLPNAEAYELIVAGRAKPADDEAAATIARMGERELRRAGLAGPIDARHVAHAARVQIGQA